MPNHVKQVVAMKGSEEDLKAIRELMDVRDIDDGKDVSCFNFNRIVPMPGTLNVGAGSGENIAKALINKPKYAFQVDSLNQDKEQFLSKVSKDIFIYFSANDPTSISDGEFKRYKKTLTDNWHLMAKDDEKLETTIKYLENYREFKATSWYDWCITNWGTKWNSYSVEWSENNEVVSFETAWSIPEPVYTALGKKFPNVNFFIFFADEDIGSNCGVLLIKGDVETYYNPQKEEDDNLSTAFANIIWGNQYETIEEWSEEQGYDTLKDAMEDYGEDEIEKIKESMAIEHSILNVAKCAMAIGEGVTVDEIDTLSGLLVNA